MFAYTAPVPPFGGLAWQEVQLIAVSGEPVWWHTVQSGAEEFGGTPVIEWQLAQSAVKLVWFAWVWVVPWKGTGWFAAPGTPEWQLTPLKEAEKQLGALGSGPVPGPSTLWQIAQAALRFPESRWETT
jgi:hypothetical protein